MSGGVSGGTIVFVGPTLGRDEVQAALPDAILLPPARQGDVFRAVHAHRPRVVTLIDGAFLHVPSVWHREILWTLDQGIGVVGAASMGALRAAELHPFGMLGVGQVFEAYREGVLPGWDAAFEDDDEVAVVHAPAELGYAPISTAMVDLRVTLVRAEAAGMVSGARRDALAGEMKRLYFPKRTLDGLAQRALDAGEDALAAWLLREHRSAKAEDARLALAARPAPAVPFRRERALAWERFAAAGAESEADRAALARLRDDPADRRTVFLQAMGRQAVLDSRPAGPADAAALGEFRTRRGLWTRAALEGWMADRGTDAAGLTRLVAEEAAVDAALARDATHVRGAMLDVLRLREEKAG